MHQITYPPPASAAHPLGLVATAPNPLRDGLQRAGLAARTLLLQPAEPHPRGGLWGVLPSHDGTLLLDLRQLSLGTLATLLVDLGVWQRQQRNATVLVVPQAHTGLRWLLASSALTGVVIAAEVPCATLAHWVRAAPARCSPQVWVQVAAPCGERASPHLLTLLAALSRATSIQQAADWCSLTRRHVQTILAQTQAALHIADDRWRTPAMWLDTLTTVILPGATCAAPYPPTLTARHRPHTPLKEDQCAF